MNNCLSYLEHIQKLEDVRTARILHAIYDSHGAKINNRRIRLDDFMPKPVAERQVQDLEEKLREFFGNSMRV